MAHSMNLYGGRPGRARRATQGLRFAGILLLAGFLLVPAAVWGADPQTMPPGVAEGLTAWRGLVERGAGSFDPAQASPVVAFVAASKEAEARRTALPMESLAPLVYFEFDVDHGLDRIIDYAYHPGIPTHILSLSSIRYSYWQDGGGRPQPVPSLAAPRDGPAQPVVHHGVEHEVITPDLFSGAYYAYDLQRSLALFRQDGRRVLVSLSRQRDVSSVGQRGFVIGRDADWNYLYTPLEGLTLPGLGWVDSFMYGSFAAMVYIETGPDTVRCGVFKWLQAGWKGLNMVKPEHILGGLERYAQTFREILDSLRLPEPAAVRSAMARIQGLSEEELRRGSRAYLLAFEEAHGQDKDFPREWFHKAVVKGDYVAALRRPDMEAAFFLEYMKSTLGKNPVLGLEAMLAAAVGPDPAPAALAWSREAP